MRDINFFSQYINNTKQSKKRFFYIVLFTSLIIITIAGSLYFYISKTSIIKEKINQNNVFLNLQENKNKIKEIDRLKYTTEIMKKYIDVSNEVKNRIENLNKINSELIINISQNIPNEITLEEISISREEIVFSGYGLDKISIAQFEYNLKKMFDDVYIYTISKNDELGYTFDGKVMIKGDSNESN